MVLGFEKAQPKLYSLAAVAGGDVDVWNGLASLGDIHIGGWHLAESMDYICSHAGSDVLFCVDSGAGELNIGAGTYPLEAGGVFILPAGLMYQITVTKPLNIVTVELAAGSLRVSEEARGIDSNKTIGKPKESLPTRSPEEDGQEKGWAVLTMSAEDMESADYDEDPLKAQNIEDFWSFTTKSLASVGQPVLQAPHHKGGFLTIHMRQEAGGEEGFVCTDSHVRFNGFAGFTIDFYSQSPFQLNADL